MVGVVVVVVAARHDSHAPPRPAPLGPSCTQCACRRGAGKYAKCVSRDVPRGAPSPSQRLSPSFLPSRAAQPGPSSRTAFAATLWRPRTGRGGGGAVRCVFLPDRGFAGLGRLGLGRVERGRVGRGRPLLGPVPPVIHPRLRAGDAARRSECGAQRRAEGWPCLASRASPPSNECATHYYPPASRQLRHGGAATVAPPAGRPRPH